MKKSNLILKLILSLCFVFSAVLFLTANVNREKTQAENYATENDYFTITKGFDLSTDRGGVYSGFYGPWGSYYGKDNRGFVNGWLYESRADNAQITLFDEVIGDFSIVFQPVQTTHNGNNQNPRGVWNLEWQNITFQFTDLDVPSNVLSVRLEDSGWYTSNISLVYNGKSYNEVNFLGYGFGGASNYTNHNNVLYFKLYEVIERYANILNFVGFERYRVNMAFGGMGYAVPANTMKCMIYELCEQSLHGEQIADNAAPQFNYGVNNVVKGDMCQLPRVEKTFDAVDGITTGSNVTYTLTDPTGSVVGLSSALKFIPAKEGEYTISVTATDNAGNVNRKKYKFNSFASYPKADITLDKEYEDNYPMGQMLTVSGAKCESYLSRGEISFDAELFFNGASEGKVTAGKAYELEKLGEYKLVYTLNDLYGYTSEYVYEFATELRPYIPEINDKLISFNNLASPETVYAKYDGVTRLMKAEIFNPKGERVKTDKEGNFVPAMTGEYKAVYSAKWGDVSAVKEQKLNCKVMADSLFKAVSSINEMNVNTDTTMYSVPGNGLEVVGGSEGTIESGVFKLSTLNTNVIAKFQIQHRDGIGVPGRTLTVSLVDALDTANVVSYNFWQSPWSVNIVYISYVYKTKNGNNILISSQSSYVPTYGTAYDGSTVGAGGGYQGRPYWGISLAGGMTNMDFMEMEFDYRTGTILYKGTEVMSLLDPACVGFANTWKGFTSDEVFFRVTLDTTTTCGINIVEFLGQSLSGESVNDTEAPIAMFEKSEFYDSENVKLPKGVAGVKYPVPQANYYDNIAGVRNAITKVINSGGKLYDIVNGCFTPDAAGRYYVCYYAVDNLGNRKDFFFELNVIDNISAENAFDISLGEEQMQAVTGQRYRVPEVNVTNSAGNFVLKEVITQGTVSVNPVTREFTVSDLNDIVVHATATDYFGRSVTKEFKISVTPSDLPVLNIKTGMPSSAFKGETVTVPSFDATDYNFSFGQEGYKPQKWILVNGVKNDSLTFTVDQSMAAAGKIVIVYCAGTDDKYAVSDEYEIAVIGDSSIGDYFLSDKNIDIVYGNYNTAFEYNGDFILKPANNLATENLEFKLGFENLSKLNIYLEDFLDPEVKVKITLENGGRDFYLNDDKMNNSRLDTFTGGGYDYVNFFLNNRSLIFSDYYGNKVSVIEKTVNGEEFTGFGNSVRITMEALSSETGKARVVLYTLSTQMIINKTSGGKFADRTPPVIVTSKGTENVKVSIDRYYSIPSATAFDFCSHGTSVRMNVYSPSGAKVINAIDCSNETKYKFTEYGTYTVEYVMNDGDKQYSKRTYINVIDEIAPTLSVNGSDVTINKGQQFKVFDATYGDGQTEAQMYVFVYDDYVSRSVTPGEMLTFDKAGKYVLRYYVLDEAYNITEKVYTITVN